MSLKRVIKVKEGIKDARARELKEVEARIESLRRELRETERAQEIVNEFVKSSFSEGLLIHYRYLETKKKQIMQEIDRLNSAREEKRLRLKEVYRDLKALEIIKEMKDREERARNTSVESQRSGFFYLVKKWRKHG
ncbi:MAG: hypothetical protein NZ526_00080 [Aquificaceae bacterium]|nr:hypothetical protein [Aquificaceae bacterium]